MSARPSPRPSRRALLRGAGGLALGGLLAACGGQETRRSTAERAGVERVTYGDDASQFLDVRRPGRGAPATLGTVVLLHGGYWLPQYDLDQLDPLADRLTSLGWVTANVEYRRTGDGGGVPRTLEDVAAAVDLVTDRLPGPVVTLGHSAGGHLAVWAASRTARTPGGRPRGELAGAVSLSGVLDLDLASGRTGSSGPVRAFTGGTPRSAPEAYAAADPTALVPASCPVWAVQAEDDQVVPLEQATAYVEAARAAGGRAERVLVPGDHFSINQPDTASAPTVERLLRRAAG